MAEENGFDKDKVLSRIRKMLALANDGAASEGERDNALRMIHNTLAKYNLSLTEAEETGQVGEARAKVGDESILPHNWARTVASAIAHLYFCEYFYTTYHLPHKIVHYFIGRESNTVTAREMAQYVVRSIQREAGKRKRELGVNGPWERSFCNGASHHIYHRCNELRRAAEATEVPKASTGTSLVLVAVYASEELANKALISDLKLKKGRSNEITNHAAGAAGYQFGGTVSLNRQVKDGQIKGRLT